MRRFIATYKQISVHFFNCVLLFVSVNALLYGLLFIRDDVLHRDRASLLYGTERLRVAYPGWSDEERDRLLIETWDGPELDYRPFVNFKEGEFHGKYVNVSPYGFRQGKVNLPWPPSPEAVNIFVFGGSTTFAYGVPDGDTIPAAMQDLLNKSGSRPVAVYNFGGAFYCSTQEAMLFVNLLRSTAAPDVAVFIDGVNEDYNDEPAYSAETRALFNAVRFWDWTCAARVSIGNLPLARAARSLSRRLGGSGETNARTERARKAPAAAARWQGNRKLIEAIARGTHTKILFVWQPTAAYHYDAQYHFLHAVERFDAEFHDEFYRRLYPLVGAQRAELEKSGNFLWLADMQERRRENLYVDVYHYNPAFCHEIAKRICEFIESHKFAQPGGPSPHGL